MFKITTIIVFSNLPVHITTVGLNCGGQVWYDVMIMLCANSGLITLMT